MKKKVLFALVLLALVAAALTWKVTQRGADDSGLVLYGNVDLRQVSLAFNGSGRIKALAATEGDRVKAGQELGVLDTKTLELEIAQAKAQLDAGEQVLLKLRNGSRPEEIAQARAKLAASQADFDNASAQLARIHSANASTEGRAVSSLDADSGAAKLKVAKANLDSTAKALALLEAGPRKEEIAEARARVEASRAQLALLEHNRDEAHLRAPVDGLVRSRLLEPGDMASPQKPVLALALLNPKWVRAYVAEADLGRIKSGMAAQVSTDSHPEQPISGRVGYISSVAEFTPKTVQTEELRTSLVYEVRVFVEDARDQLRLGMPATVRIARTDK
ncbi:HlyD family efflux transporter periplasmic adaptor subunit [Niveibacterium terrae]|uniref:HlyD family efflux transporter periplasmic adaptor subunit n=1 Tax=Niveibacterium terrae TaxID=3373598 RepID=UPI003A9358A8